MHCGKVCKATWTWVHCAVLQLIRHSLRSSIDTAVPSCSYQKLLPLEYISPHHTSAECPHKPDSGQPQQGHASAAPLAVPL